MKSLYLLPNQFKKIGIVLFPFGLFIWISTQLGWYNSELNASMKVAILASSFFSSLFGLYFTIFSKEVVEDEYINSVRLSAFQISSLVQMAYFIISFVLMFLFKNEPNGDGGLSLFFLYAITIFWVTYLAAFNITLIVNKIKFNAQQSEGRES
jgi:hypothetical protein